MYYPRACQLVLFFALSVMATTTYNTGIPESAIIVSSWETFYKEAGHYPNSAMEDKYGGYVIEVDGKIVVATDDAMTENIRSHLADIEARDEEASSDGTAGTGQTKDQGQLRTIESKASCRRSYGADNSNRPRALDNSVPFRIFCSHPPCYFSSLCTTYSACYVCTGANLDALPQAKRGRCI
jgi:hypothetical protein